MSLSLDGELSEFERALLNAHMARCAECSLFAGETRAATALLRGAPLEQVHQPVTLPIRRRAWRASALHLASAAAVVIGALALARGVATTSEPRIGGVPPVQGMSEDVSDRLIRASQRRAFAPEPVVVRHRPVLLPL